MRSARTRCAKLGFVDVFSSFWCVRARVLLRHTIILSRFPPRVILRSATERDEESRKTQEAFCAVRSDPTFMKRK